MEKLKIAATGRWLSVMCASLGMLLAVPGTVLAQSTLTWARVELTRNEVKLFTNGQSRRARVSDVLGINDALSTASRARAELRFNDGSLARIGESAVFRFTPNTRNFRLSNGTVLLLIPPGQGRSTIQTPNAVTGIHGSALFVRFVPETSTTIIGALTNNPDGPMTAFNHDGSEQQSLFAGEMAVIRGEQPIERFLFDLETFYDTSSLGQDLLQLDDPNASIEDEAIEAVRQEILDALAQQAEFDEAGGPVFENPAFLSASPAAPPMPVATVPDFNVSPASAFLRQTVVTEGFDTIVAPTAAQPAPSPAQPTAGPAQPVTPSPAQPTAPTPVDPPVKPVVEPPAQPIEPAPVAGPISEPTTPEPLPTQPVKPPVEPITPEPAPIVKPTPPAPSTVVEQRAPEAVPETVPVEDGFDNLGELNLIDSGLEPETTEVQIDRLPDAIAVEGTPANTTPEEPSTDVAPPGQVGATPGQSGAPPPGQVGATPGQNNSGAN